MLRTINWIMQVKARPRFQAWGRILPLGVGPSTDFMNNNEDNPQTLWNLIRSPGELPKFLGKIRAHPEGGFGKP
jgi:hypothetical protein